MHFSKAPAARALRAALVAAVAAAAGMGAAHADDAVTFRLQMAEGKLNPARIEVPAGKRIRIEVSNAGHGAAEFESLELRKEKVLAPGAESVVVIAPLERGEYKFFDDFRHEAQGVIVAK